MNTLYKITLTLAGMISVLSFQSCEKDFLSPKPLSFYSPENTYVNESGMTAAVVACEKSMRSFYYDQHCAINTQYRVSDLSVFANWDVSGGLTDLDLFVTPTQVADGATNKIAYFWNEQFNGVKYANIILNRLSNAEEKLSDAQMASFMGQGYFFRAWNYYNLVHQFGDVPWIGKEVQEAKLDFYSYDRWSILEQLEKDMKFAYDNIPENRDRGMVNKWGAGVLYMKILMCNQKWDEAIKVGKEIIDARPLMTSRMNSSYPNLQLDLHSFEAKFNPANTEGLHYVISVPGVPNDKLRICTMREWTPYWGSGTAIKTPDGQTGANVTPKEVGSIYDNDLHVGQGQGMTRPSNFYQYEIWTDMEKNDERGRFNQDSWRDMEDLYYNVNSAGSWYGKHLVRPENMTESDSLRCWFSWPHYKMWVPDPDVTAKLRGGETPWYIYRTAEVYQLVAECYYWKGDLENEKVYLNVVRKRAGADPYTSVKGIYEILAERARELYREEFRHDELCRIAYTYAKTGKLCEEFNTTYTLDKFSGNGGVGENLKQNGYNFYFDWVNKHNGIFNSGAKLGDKGEYKISVHHVLWPVPETSITSNSKGVINQTPGYVTPYKNATPKKVGED